LEKELAQKSDQKASNKEQDKKIKDLIAENLYLKSEQTRLETENDNLHGMLKGKEYGSEENKAAVTI